MEPRFVRQRFESSAFIRDRWPPELRQRTVEYFAPQAVLDDLCVWGHYNPIEALHGVLTLSSLRTLPLLLMGTDPIVQRIAVPLYEAGARDADLEFEVGARALSERDYEGAAQHLALVTEATRSLQARLLRTLALGLLGKEAEARQCLDSIDRSALTPNKARSAEWLERFLRGGQRPSGATGGGQKLPAAAPQ